MSDSFESGALVAAGLILLTILVIKACSPSKKLVAEALMGSGWTLYTRPGCGYCTKQLKIVGSKFTRTVDCSPNANGTPMACSDPSITGFPFWKNSKTGATRVGLQELSELEKMATRGK